MELTNQEAALILKTISAALTSDEIMDVHCVFDDEEEANLVKLQQKLKNLIKD